MNDQIYIRREAILNIVMRQKGLAFHTCAPRIEWMRGAISLHIRQRVMQSR